MKKIFLGNTIEDPFDIFGILCPSPSYVLAHYINEFFSYDLKRLPDDLLFELKNTQSHHPIFSYQVPDNFNKIYLIGNKAALPLIAERKEMDYLLVIKGEQRIFDLKSYIAKAKKIKGVQYIDYIYSEQLKSLQNHPLNYLP